MSHPNGYTKEMIKEMLGTAWLDKDNIPESGNKMRRRLGNEMRAKGIKKTFPSKESRIADNSGRFDENGKYIYPPGSGFNYMESIDPNSPWNCTGGKVS
jgi:hypothetical protein